MMLNDYMLFLDSVKKKKEKVKKKKPQHQGGLFNEC